MLYFSLAYASCHEGQHVMAEYASSHHYWLEYLYP